MTTTINIGFTPGPAYTWNSYPLTWDDPSSGALSWATANAGNVYTLGIDETLAYVEALRRTITLPKAEAFGIVDAKVGWTFTKKVTETLSTVDVWTRLFTVFRTYAETLSTVDLRWVTATARNPETLTTVDVNSRNATHISQEAFATVDVNRKAVTHIEGQAFGTVDVGRRTVSPKYPETLNTVDVLRFAATKIYPHTLGVADAKVGWQFSQPLFEFWNTADVYIKHVTMIKPHTVDIEEINTNDPIKILPQAFGVADTWVRTLTIFRTYTEALNIIDPHPRQFTKRLFDAWGQKDMWIMKGPIVASDMVLREDALSYIDFVSAAGSELPYTYSNYVPFIPGDYNLTKASVKVVITRENTSQDTRLTFGKVSIDIPDVADRGTVIISDASDPPSWVSFNRIFVTEPEVTVTGVSATEFVQPRIYGKTKLGFYVELINADNVKIAGRVSWTALGY